MIATKHFKLRVKDRLGLKKKNANKYLQKAIKHGIDIESTTCRPNLNKYLNTLIIDNDIYNIIIYNRHIIIYSQTGVAITLLRVPKKFHSTIKSIYKERG